MFVEPADPYSVGWVVISPPLDGVREHVKSRSLVSGVEPRRFPSVVLPRVITPSVITDWLRNDDLGALDFAALTALCDGGHGARNCSFDKMSTRMALDRLIRNFRESDNTTTLTHPRTPAIYSRMASHYIALRDYVKVAEEMFEWEEKLLNDGDDWISTSIPMYSRQAEAARLALVRDKMSLEEFQSALLEVREVIKVVGDGMPTELAQELFSLDWQKGCLKYVSVRDEPSGL